jgi:hypothetical protein
MGRNPGGYPSFEFARLWFGSGGGRETCSQPIVKLSEMEEPKRYVIQDRFAQLGARWIAADLATHRQINSAMYRSTSWRLKFASRNQKTATFIKTLGDISRKPV